MSEGFFNGIKKGQKNFGETIATIINFILLSFVYFIGVGLTSIIAKICGKHFLDLKIDKNKKTYWENYSKKDEKMEEYYRQF